MLVDFVQPRLQRFDLIEVGTRLDLQRAFSERLEQSIQFAIAFEYEKRPASVGFIDTVQWHEQGNGRCASEVGGAIEVGFVDGFHTHCNYANKK